jgi:hypothetical protein
MAFMCLVHPPFLSAHLDGREMRMITNSIQENRGGIPILK